MLGGDLPTESIGRKRQPFLWLALAAVLGTALGDIAPWPSWLTLAAAGALCLFAPFHPGPALAMVAALFCAGQQIGHREAPGRSLALRLGEEARLVRVEGTVDSFPERRESGTLRFLLRADRIEAGGQTAPGPVNLMVQWEGGEIGYGARVRLSGRLRNIPGPRNPGEFDYRAFLERRGIWSELRVRGAGAGELLPGRGGNPAMRWAGAAREWMRGRLKAGIEDDPARAALVESMVLGVTEDAPPEVARVFRETGTLHLFAVSGLNVAMFGMIVWAGISPLGFGRRATSALVIPAVLFYAMITGLTPSGVRAAIMAAVILGGAVADRRALAGNTLGAAGFFVLAWDGNQLFQPGCQLSFGVVAAMMAWAGPIGRRLGGLFAPDPLIPAELHTPLETLAATASARFGRFSGACAAAWLGALPLNLLYFQAVAPVALAANLLAVPVAFAVLATGMAGVLGGAASGWCASVFAHANWLLVASLLDAMRWCAAIPFGHFPVGLPEPRPADAAMVVFDFAGGGGVLLRAGGEVALVDAGGESDYRRSLSGYLRRHGIGRVDAFFWTHGDVAHLGGAPGLIAERRVGEIFEPLAKDRSATRREAAALADAARIPRHGMAAGDHWVSPGGAIRVEVIYPPPGIDPPSADDEALVLSAAIGGRRALLMSDAGFAAERWLLDRGGDLRADFLVRGVHARDPGPGRDFLERVRPSVLISGYDDFLPSRGVDVGAGEAVAGMGGRWVRLDRSGGVTVRFRGGGYGVEGFLDGAESTSRVR